MPITLKISWDRKEEFIAIEKIRSGIKSSLPGACLISFLKED